MRGAVSIFLSAVLVSLILPIMPAHGAEKSVGDLVGELKALVDPDGNGRHDTTPIKGSYSLEMLKEWASVTHELEKRGSKYFYDDEEFVFEEWAKETVQDEARAGTITMKVMLKAALSAFDYWMFQFWPYDELTEDEQDKIKAQVTVIIKQLKSKGVYFAYDGYEQHGCAAPTEFLIVLDVQGDMVYGIDFNPCRE